VDSGRATIEVMPEIIEAVGGRIPVLVDSGFRRGTDIIKALAMGAQAVCIGRPYLWGLGAFGQAGVERVLEILRKETRELCKRSGHHQSSISHQQWYKGPKGALRRGAAKKPPRTPHAIKIPIGAGTGCAVLYRARAAALPEDRSHVRCIPPHGNACARLPQREQ
jgi:hypothetical protein